MTTTRTRTPRERLETSVNTAVTIRRDYAMPVDPPETLKLSVSMGDLKTVALSALRTRFLSAREVASRQVNEAKQAYDQAVRQLEMLGREFLKAYRPPNCEVILAALKSWTDEEHEVNFVKSRASSHRGASTYDHQAWEERPEDQTPEIDCETQTIKGNIRFCARAGAHKDSYISELIKDVELPFPPDMAAQMVVIIAAKIVADRAQRELNQVNRLIAELPQQGDKIQSALTKAHLLGQIRGSQDIWSLIENLVTSLALPAGIGQALAALPATTE